MEIWLTWKAKSSNSNHYLALTQIDQPQPTGYDFIKGHVDFTQSVLFYSIFLMLTNHSLHGHWNALRFMA